MVASSSSSMDPDLLEEIRKAGGWTSEQLPNELRFAVAARLFAEHKISIGRATELSGIPMEDFMKRVSDMGIPVIDLDDDELREEFRRE